MGIIIYIIKTTMLTSDNRFALNGSIGGISGGIKFADNALTCDSEGNCMLKDELIKIGGSMGKFGGSISFDDDDLVDDLGFKKFMQKAGKSTVKVTKSAAKGTVKAVKSIAKSDVGKAAIKTGSKMAVDTAMASLTDELISIGGRVGKFSGSVKFDDDDEDDDDLVDDLKAGDRIKSAAKKVGSGIKTAAKKVGSGIKKVAGKVHSSAMKNGGYSGSVSAGGIKGKVGYGNKLDDDSDDDDLADDLALFIAIKEKRQAAKAKRAAKKAAMQEAEVKDDDLVDELIRAKGCVGEFCASVGRDDDLVDELWKVGGKIGKFSGSVSRDDDLVDDLGSVKGKIGKFSGGVKWADNSLTCDSEGNCMLKDELKFEKVKAAAGAAAKRFPGAASKVANKVKSLRGRDDDDE